MKIASTTGMERSFRLACLLGVATVFACTSASQQPPSQTQAVVKVTSPVTGLEVTVALASAHLGAEKCTHDESADLTPKSCAVPVGDAATGTGLCGGPCDFSSVQLAFTPGTGGQTAHVHVAGAAILDAATGAELQSLTAYTPLVWNGTAYVTWDEAVAPSTASKTRYTLSPPSWSTIDTSNSYSRQYRVRIDLTVDGAAVSLESDALSRDPPVAT